VIIGLAFNPKISRSAESQIQKYMKDRAKDNKVSDEIWTLIVGTAGDSFQTSNAYLKNQKFDPIYCPPNIAIQDSQYVSILDNYLEKEVGKSISKIPDVSVPAALMYALIDVFPCDKTKK